MNKTKTIYYKFDFSPVNMAILGHMTNVMDAHSRYHAAVDQAKVYNSEIQQRKTEEAEKGLKAALAYYIDAYREKYAAAVDSVSNQLDRSIESQTVPDSLASKIATYRNMNIKPNKRELELLARQAAGNYLAVRAVAEVAKGSGYKVNCLTSDQLEEDLNGLRQLCRDCENFAPREGVQLTASIMGVPAWAVQASSDVALNADEKIKAVADRWEEIATPYVIEWSEAQEKVEQETYRARQAIVSPDYEAQAIAYQAAQGKAEYNRVMQYYIKGGAAD